MTTQQAGRTVSTALKDLYTIVGEFLLEDMLVAQGREDIEKRHELAFPAIKMAERMEQEHAEMADALRELLAAYEIERRKGPSGNFNRADDQAAVALKQRARTALAKYDANNR